MWQGLELVQWKTTVHDCCGCLQTREKKKLTQGSTCTLLCPQKKGLIVKAIRHVGLTLARGRHLSVSPNIMCMHHLCNRYKINCKE